MTESVPADEEAALAAFRRLLMRALDVVGSAQADDEPELAPDPAP